MQCKVIKQFNRRGEPQLPGSIITISPDKLPILSGFVEPLAADSYQDRTQCRFWGQVCEFAGALYLDDCTGTGDEQCSIFRFLALNTRSDSKGELAA